MADERTPLIQVVTVAPARQRYGHHTLRRFCTIALTTTLIVIVLFFIFSPPWLDVGYGWGDGGYPGNGRKLPNQQTWPFQQTLEYEELEKILLETPNEDRAREWSAYYTSGPHLAGKNLSQAEWTRDKWLEFGIADSRIATYDVYINYPTGHRLALLEASIEKNSSAHGGLPLGEDSFKVKYECSLEEDVLEEDSTTGLENRIPTFHGYSASGNVTAPYVYVNFGTYQDFEDLLKANVSLEGKIALARYGHIFRGLKVKRAQQLGMIGVVLFTDPGSGDGDTTEENGYEPYPNGPARNPSAVQRGSVQYLSDLPGDPTTPGYPSLPGVDRQDPSFSTPKIPSVPISINDALPLLRALNGYGPKASDFDKYWQGGGLGYKGVEYNIGPSPPELVLNLMNHQEYVINPLWNVIGVINGTIPDEVIVIGNHRDAWIAGGASDPNSGSSALNEVIRSFGAALKAGWKPLRTIVFASWDGEEYGLVGSTEWVEQYIPWLSGSAVAYLNLDVATSGQIFKCAAAPLLNKLIYEVTSIVPSPNQTVKGQSIGDTWDGKIATMGSGSDFTAFQDFAGIPSMDFSFIPSNGGPVYHYHSNYDSFHWMEKFGDPSFGYHVASARILSLLAAKLAETPIIRLNSADYATELSKYLDRVVAQADESGTDTSKSKPFKQMQKALRKLKVAAVKFDKHAAQLATKLESPPPWWKWWKRVKLITRARRTNSKYKKLERQFLYEAGLDGRPWFKHVVFAPGKWTGYSGATYPGLVEAIDEKNDEALERWSKVIAARIEAATELLKC